MRGTGAASRHGRLPRHQRGAALLALALLLTVFVLYGLLTSVGTAVQRSDRDARSFEAILQAKQALIARAALDENKPGSLTCPAKNEAGTSSGICSAANDQVGRVPWKTLGAPRFADADGEQLWYALSPSFQPSAGAINSDTPGTLEIRGDTPQKGVVAVLIAPGAALSYANADPNLQALQSRPPGAARLDAANYLEGENNFKRPAELTNNGVFERAARSEGFNDLVVALTAEDLFQSVDAVVARRIDKEVRPLLERHRTAWGAFPFAAGPFDPAAPDFAGDVGTLAGFIPVDNSTQRPVFQPGPTVTKSPSDTNPANTVGLGSSCAPVTGASAADCAAGSALDCTISHAGTPRVRISGAIHNVGVAVLRDRLLVPSASIDPVGRVSDAPAERPLVSGSTDSATGHGSYTIEVQISAAGPGISFTRFKVCAPTNAFDPPEVASDPYPAWFKPNGWQRLVYYRAMNGCSGPGSCVTLRKPDGSTVQAAGVLAFAGVKLAGRTRPSSNAADYFEEANATAVASMPALPVFEQRPVSRAFNDRVIGLGTL